jgi:peptidyl-dipeptidase Dcp
MHKPLSMIVVLSALATPPWAADAPSSPATAPGAPNPFSEPSQLPYALPPFDSIKDSDFEPAFEAGMLEQRARVDAIAHDPEPATLENTLVALERSSLMLDRVSKVFFNLDGSNTDPDIQKIKLKMTPRLAAHRDAIYLNPDLFARVETVWRARAELGDPEAAQLAQR